MKKIFSAFCLFLFSLTAYALPSGNPADPGLYCHGFFEEYCEGWSGWNCFQNSCFNFRIGFYGDYVFNRYFQIDTSDDSSSIRTTDLNTNAGEIVLNLWNRLDLFAAFGATTIHLEGATGAFRPSATGGNDTLVINTSSDISYSLGLRALLWNCGRFSFGASGQYFTTQPHVTSVYSNYSSFITTYPENVRFKYHEWQVNGGVAYRACFASGLEIIPYANLVGGHAYGHFGNPTLELNPGGGGGTAAFTATLLDLMSEHSFGYALGVALLGYEKVSLGIEGRFMNEKALFFNAQARF